MNASEQKIIYSENPIADAHSAAMAVAFNSGSTVTVTEDPLLPVVRLFNWKEECIAAFMHTPYQPFQEGLCPTSH